MVRFSRWVWRRRALRRMSYQYELIWFLSIIQTVKKNKRETFPPVDRIHHHIPVLISSNIARKGAINSSTDEILVIMRLDIRYSFVSAAEPA